MFVSSPATNAIEHDDIYLTSSDEEDDEKSVKTNGEVGNFDVISDDDGADSEEREALESDEATDGEDEYGKALAKEVSLRRKVNTLLTDLDTADEETKRKRKIENWCSVAELKVSKSF